MTYSEIVEEVKLLVRSATPDLISKVPTYVNDAISAICEDTDVLDLKKMTAVATVASQSWLTMPTGFSGKLRYVGTTEGKLNIKADIEALLEDFPGLDETGDISDVALLGSILYYQRIPDTVTYLTIVYYADPTLLVSESDIPTYIPIALHGMLIVPKAALLVFDKVESEDEEIKKNVSVCEGNYLTGLTKYNEWKARRTSHLSKSIWDN